MSAQPRVLSYPEAAVPPALRRQVLALHEQAWPGGDELGHDPALRPRSMLLVAGEQVVATLDILSKDFEHLGSRYAASGLSAVVTDRAQRGRGHGRRLVAAARSSIQADGRDLAVFTCDRELRGFYEDAGFEVLTGAVLLGGTPQHPLPSDELDKLVLACFFSDRARAAAAGFQRRRLALYPGERDRLW